jgi:protein Tob/BTG
MKLETESAANFLIHLMRISQEKSSRKIVSPKKLEKLQKAIVERLQSRYRDHWFPEKPYKGSGYRCLRINGKLDFVLVLACNDCEIEPHRVLHLLPSELAMWIDPLETSYRIGENGSICTLYQYPNSQPWTPKLKPPKPPPLPLLTPPQPPPTPSGVRRNLMSQICRWPSLARLSAKEKDVSPPSYSEAVAAAAPANTATATAEAAAPAKAAPAAAAVDDSLLPKLRLPPTPTEPTRATSSPTPSSSNRDEFREILEETEDALVMTLSCLAFFLLFLIVLFIYLKFE